MQTSVAGGVDEEGDGEKGEESSGQQKAPHRTDPLDTHYERGSKQANKQAVHTAYKTVFKL